MIQKLYPNPNPYPPEPYFDLILKNCPKAALLYKKLWKEKGVDFIVILDKERVESENVSTKRFRHNLKLLLEEGMVSFLEDDYFYKIELLGWKDEDE
jgi:hypothetical protein